MRLAIQGLIAAPLVVFLPGLLLFSLGIPFFAAQGRLAEASLVALSLYAVVCLLLSIFYPFHLRDHRVLRFAVLGGLVIGLCVAGYAARDWRTWTLDWFCIVSAAALIGPSIVAVWNLLRLGFLRQNEKAEPIARANVRAGARPWLSFDVRRKRMKSFLLAFIVASLSACDRSAPPPPKVAKPKATVPVEASRPDVIQFAFPKPLARAHVVVASDLLAAPDSYNEKRVILAGTYTGGWETSDFQLDGPRPDFSIWAELDWKEINLPFGDFAESRGKWGRAKPNEGFVVRYRVVAEGTFYFRRDSRPLGLGGEPGFGHFGVSKGAFLIDRLFELEPLPPETPNKALEPTP